MLLKKKIVQKMQTLQYPSLSLTIITSKYNKNNFYLIIILQFLLLVSNGKSI